MKRQLDVKPSAPRFVCQCGLAVRQVVLPDGELIWVDERPLPGGPLIVNADRVVGSHSKFTRRDGFRRHQFSPRCRLVAA